MASTILNNFSTRHIPGLIIGTTLTFGGAIPFFNPAYAMHEFGLPLYLVKSKDAQDAFTVSAIRTVALGLSIYMMFAQRMYRGVDIMLACIGTTGILDGWLCWKVGVPGRGVFRATCAVLVAGWGWMGLTSV
ncbi:hypothetical protein TWF481_002308 [Arthrobotrys musiformis]|uniref:Uncharacterized protein n=1 Tax=Arthrobotrys musiformis TaxID=47236 RepID=A0AAV9VSY6_9PEZI